MHEPRRLALGGNQIIPAACHVPRRRKSENAVGKGISLVVIEKEPAVQLLVPQLVLNPVDIHCESIRSTSAGSAPAISTTLTRLASPCTIRTAERATPKRSAKNRMHSSLAFPSTGG